MQIDSIETIFENGHFVVHCIDVAGEILHRTTLPSTVGLILHDPVDDTLALSLEQDLSIFSERLTIPEYVPESMESASEVALRICEGYGTTVKSITFVQTIVSDLQHSSKQVTLMYVVVDSRTLPSELYATTGTDVIKQLGQQGPISAPKAIAAHYLKLVRLKKA